VKKTGFKLSVNGSNGATEAQVRSINLGAEPDVLTLDNPGAVDELARKGGLLPADWQSRLPNNSSPYTTTVVFVVEKGNPKNIRDWSDLVRDDVSVITPDPRTSGRGQWNFLAAWGSVLRSGGSDQQARDFVDKLYGRVPVLNSSARGAAETFTARKVGDVLVVWESDAYKLVQQSGDRKLVVVTPPSTILVEPPVTWVDRNVDKHENARVAVSFLKFLYTEEAQAIIARHHFRPRLPQIADKHGKALAETNVFTVAEQFGGWSEAAKRHFATGQSADQVLHTTAQISSGPIPRS
jgi:sulfate transport system substrate-binding protein